MKNTLKQIAEGKDSIEVVRNLAREALAQQSNEQVEPVAWRTTNWGHDNDERPWAYRDYDDPFFPESVGQPLYTHPPVPTAQPKEPEQEPTKVGTIGHIGDGKTTLTAVIAPLLAAQPDENLAATVSDEVILDVLGSIDYNPKHHKTPLTKYQIIELGQKMFELGSKNLYTTPPQRTWVKLTDEDRAQCIQATAKRGSTYELISAIEAKLKEKNERLA